MTNEPSQRSFFAELKRRKVVQVTVAYLGASSILLEVTDNLFEVLLLQDFQRPLVIAVAAGLPVVVALAWIFDLTKKGVVLTAPVEDSPEGSRTRFTRQFVLSGAIVVLAMVAVGWRYLPSSRVEFEDNRVAVMPLTNDTGDPGLDPVGTVVARELGRELERLEGLVIDPDEHLPLGLAASGAAADPAGTSSVSPAHAVAERTRARLVVTGSYHRGGGGLVLRVEVYDATRRERVYPGEPVEVDVDDLMTGVTRLQEGLFGFLADRGDDEALIEVPGLFDHHPPSYAAYKEYVLALELIRTNPFSRREQLIHVDSAVALDSSFVGAMTLSALLHGAWGQPERARPLLDRLEAMRADLTPVERAGVDRARAVTEHDIQGAYRASTVLADLVGSSMSQYLAGRAALDVNRPYEARDRLLRFDRTRMSHPAIYQTLGRAYHLVGSYRAELRLVKELRERHPLSVGIGFLRITEMGALAAVGRGAEALERLGSFELENASPQMLLDAADEIQVHGAPEVARTVRERLLARHESIPENERDRSYRMVRARLLASLGRDAQAAAILRGLIDENPDNPEPRVEAALVAARTGDRASAEEAIDWVGQRLPRPQRGSVAQARIAASLGDAERVVRFLREAEEAGETDFLGLHVDPAYAPIRGDPAFTAYMQPRDRPGLLERLLGAL